MRALVMHEIGALRVEERDVPLPKNDEVQVRISATGICGSDVHGYTGENGRRHPGQIMGHESAGRISALGSDVTDLGLGQAVTFNPVVVPTVDADAYAGREQHAPDKIVLGVAPEHPAAFADYMLVPRRNIVTLPDELPIEYGALIEPIAVALHAVRRVLRSGDQRVLVIGGGPIGQSTVLAFQAEGIRDVFVSELDPKRRELCAALGATALDPALGSPIEALADLGGAVDVTIDAVGISETLRSALHATGLGGSVCLVGMGNPNLELDAFRVSTEERSIIGSFTYSAQDFTDAAALVAANPAGLDVLIGDEVAPEDADRAFRLLADGEGPAGKILVRFDR